ncbi:hypothetical protein JCGZ_07473 [Jatropha curcas]|uniref:MYB family protein n=1 Tax=Jatropha curcas TaxID=180498 RepID=A0A067KCN4_JATCU|nr:MYB family protein [Jatropha curcas]KDP33902.1 hypothetical protein JCGZ_07473 [Jatropha curcas]
MGRNPCCAKEGLNRGAWNAYEDQILINYIKANGEGRWRSLSKRAGLKRCGKSCRLRWLNYLRPDIKRGNISPEEEELIIRLHRLLGNRWSLIAGRLPGRTDNEIKNYWNTNLGKKTQKLKSLNNINNKAENSLLSSDETALPSSPPKMATHSHVFRSKAFKCTKVLLYPNSIQLENCPGPSPPPLSSSVMPGETRPEFLRNGVQNNSDINNKDRQDLMIGDDLHFISESDGLNSSNFDYHSNVNSVDHNEDDFVLSSMEELPSLLSEDFTVTNNEVSDHHLNLSPLTSFLESGWVCPGDN